MRPSTTIITSEKVLAIARSKGFFCVTHHYRNDALRKRLHKMRTKGLLRKLTYREVNLQRLGDPRKAMYFVAAESNVPQSQVSEASSSA